MALRGWFGTETEKRTVPTSRTADELLGDDGEYRMWDAAHEVEAAPEEPIDTASYAWSTETRATAYLSAVMVSGSLANLFMGHVEAGTISGYIGVLAAYDAYQEAKEDAEDTDPTALQMSEVEERLEESRAAYGDRFGVAYLDGERQRVDTNVGLDDLTEQFDSIREHVDEVEVTYEQPEDNPFFSIGIKGVYQDAPLPEYREEEYAGRDEHEVVVIGLDPDYAVPGEDDCFDQATSMRAGIDEQLETDLADQEEREAETVEAAALSDTDR